MYNYRRKANVLLLMTNQRSCWAVCPMYGASQCPADCMEPWTNYTMCGYLWLEPGVWDEMGMDPRSNRIHIHNVKMIPARNNWHRSAATATTTDQQQISLSSSVVAIKHLICLFFFVMIQLKNSLCLDNCCSHAPPRVWDQLPLFVFSQAGPGSSAADVVNNCDMGWVPANNDWDTAY